MTLLAARQRLIERGLIDADFRLTDAGNTEVDRLLHVLPRIEATNDRDGRGVRWNWPRKAA